MLEYKSKSWVLYKMDFSTTPKTWVTNMINKIWMEDISMEKYLKLKCYTNVYIWNGIFFKKKLRGFVNFNIG